MTTLDTTLDPKKPAFIYITGKKGYGKSELAARLFDSYPYDRMVIDPTRDAKLHEDVKVTDLEVPYPVRWPPRVNDERMTLRCRPDMGSETYPDDLDRAVGIALHSPNKRCLLWVDEIGELTKPSGSPPNMRRALALGRHQGLSLLMCGPRPINVDPLCIQQADVLYLFKLPNPRDRERVASTIGWPPKEFDDAMAEVGRFDYLRYDAVTDDLAHFPPIPLTDRERPRVR